MIAVGDIVDHGRFGEGTVLQIRHGGYDARVDFDGFALWVPASALRLVAKAPPEETAASRAAPSRKRRTDDQHSRSLVESLRLGIVPDAGLKDWTVGRTGEFDTVARWLDAESEGTLLIEGTYGSGKTHLLRYLAREAREEGFAVSLVRIDPCQENSSFPMRFYASVMRNLQIPVEGAVLEIQHALREAALGNGESSLPGHPFLGPLVERIRAGEESEADWLGLMGERSESSLFPTGLDFTTVANLACNLLSAVSHFISRDLNLKGLLVLVDEVETAEVRRYHYHWKRTLNFLRGISLVANDDDVLDESVRRDRHGTRIGGATGLVYSGHYPDVKYYYRFPTMLKVVLALTECKVSGRMREWKAEQPRMVLSDIDGPALTGLYRRLAAEYASLYGVRIPRHLERWLLNYLLFEAYGAGSIRAFTKAMVEAFDFVRHHPGEPVEALEAYREF